MELKKRMIQATAVAAMPIYGFGVYLATKGEQGDFQAPVPAAPMLMVESSTATSAVMYSYVDTPVVSMVTGDPSGTIQKFAQMAAKLRTI